MVKALFDANILVDHLNAVAQPTILAGVPCILSAIAMMNAGQKRVSISATLDFADLRQVTNELEEAHQYSIFADEIQQDRSVLLPSYESTSLAHPTARSTLRTLTWKSTGRQPRKVLRALRDHSRAGVVHFVEVRSSLLRPWQLATRSE